MTDRAAPFIHVVDCGSRKVPDIARLLDEAGARVTTILLEMVTAATLSTADAVVVSGGSALFTDPGTGAELAARFAFLDSLDVPVLGICLGHQALALRAGGTVFRGIARRDHEEIEVLREHPLLDGMPRPLVMREDHTEGVEGAPPGFRIIARSASYANEMMVARSRPAFGVQFHPEVSGEAGARFLDNFVAFVRQQR